MANPKGVRRAVATSANPARDSSEAAVRKTGFRRSRAAGRAVETGRRSPLVMTAGDALIPERYCSAAQEVRREIERGSKGPAMSRRGGEDVIPVRLSSDDFAVWRGPTFDKDARKSELAQRICEEEQVAGKAGAGKEQTWQVRARDGEHGPGPKAGE